MLYNVEELGGEVSSRTIQPRDRPLADPGDYVRGGTTKEVLADVGGEREKKQGGSTSYNKKTHSYLLHFHLTKGKRPKGRRSPPRSKKDELEIS